MILINLLCSIRGLFLLFGSLLSVLVNRSSFCHMEREIEKKKNCVFLLWYWFVFVWGWFFPEGKKKVRKEGEGGGGEERKRNQ